MEYERNLRHNHAGSKMELQFSINRLNETIKELKNVRSVLSYKTDGNLINRIIKKSQGSIKLLKTLQFRCEKLDEEFVVPFRRMK